MNSKESIYIVTMRLDVGGTETQILSLCDGLKNQYKIKLFSFSTTGLLYARFKKMGVDVRGIHKPFSKNRLCLFLRAIRVFFNISYAILFLDRPKIIQSFLPLPNFLGAIIGRLFSIPSVTCWRSLTGYRDRNLIAYKMDQISLNLSRKIVCNSQAVLDDLATEMPHIRHKADVIYNGLTFSSVPLKKDKQARLKKSLGLQPGNIGIIYVANLIEYKGHRDLLKALSILSSSTLKNIKLFLAGKDGGIATDLKQYAKQLGIHKHVSFLGLRHDVHDLLQVMDMGVMASHEEGFSNALLEKLEAGLSVVVTDVGGNKEAIKGLQHCFIAPAKDPDLLSKEILKATQSLGDSAWKKKNRDHVRARFSNEKMVVAYKTLIGKTS